MNSTKKYYGELNIFRALIIIWVIIGHSFDDTLPFTSALHSYAYTFHMSAFFLLSGLLFAKKIKAAKTIKQKAVLVKDRALRLLVPYLFFTVVSYCLKYVFGEYANNPLPSGTQIFTDVLLGINNPNGGLWFLHNLFVFSVIAIIISFIPDILTFCITVGIYILTIAFNLSNFQLITYFMMFFFAGIVISSYYSSVSQFFDRAFSKKKSKYTVIAICLLFVFISVSLFITELKFSLETNIIFKLLLCVINILCWYLISQLLSHSKLQLKLINEIGNYGMDIYMIGYYVQISLRVVLNSMLGLPYLVYSICMMVFGLLLPIPISKYIVRRFKITRALVLGDFKNNNAESSK